VRIYVHLFGAAREKAGRNLLEVEVRPPATAGDVAAQILLHHTALGDLLRTAAIAVDRRFATLETPVTEGSEVALLPPLSGG
jgi:molybdopterin converting factor small subunit